MRLIPLAILVAAAACSSGSNPPDPRAPDFALLDVNPASPTSAQAVSPRDKVGKTSAFYFGAAT
jgi:hypothetical protein